MRIACALALTTAAIPPAPAQDAFGEIIDVRTGFARVTEARGTDRPLAGDFRVSWNGTQQVVREVLGGPGSPIEVGIAIDLSASMHESTETMRSAVGEFLQSELSAADRVFVTGFSDRLALVADGLDESLNAIATVTTDARPGLRRTRFFDGLEDALSQFRNSSPRAVLVAVSDGCDSLQQESAGQRLLERAADLAIPIVLIAPDQRDCRTTNCELKPSGQWNCVEERPAPIVRFRARERDPFNPTHTDATLFARSPTSRATATRDSFAARLKAGAGGFILARSDAEWRRGVESVRSLLDRQWMVVFEPSSEAVRSSEVRVKFGGGSRPAVSADRSAESRPHEAKALTSPTDSTDLSATESDSAAPTTAEPVLENAPVIQEQIGVEVVSVDLVATDRRGRRILDLAREEFQIEVDGEPRSLDYFSAPRGLAPEAVETLETPRSLQPAPGGTVFLVLDRTTLEARDLNRVIASFRSLVSSPGFAGRTFVVASLADAPFVHQPGTSDLDEVERALDEMSRSRGQAELRRLERRQIADAIRTQGSPEAMSNLLVLQIQALEDLEVSRQSALMALVQDLVTTSADPDEPNTLLIAGEGFSADPERYLRELLSNVAGLRADLMLAAQDAAPTRHLFVLAEVEKLARILQERRVTAYTLIPAFGSIGPESAELRTTGRTLDAAPREDIALAETAANVATLADSTGGSRIPIFSDLEQRIDAVALDRQASYSLGFTTGPEAGFESHEIRVSTSRPGTTLRYRASYRRLSPSEQWQAALAAAARSGIVNSALPIGLRIESATIPTGGKNGSRTVPLILEIPLAQLSLQPSPDRSTDVSELTVQIAVDNSANALVHGPEETIEVSVPHAELELARQGAWSHRVEVVLPEGRASVGALVIERSTGAWATASCAIPARN